MEEIEFLVQGSAPNPYRIVFKKVGLNLTATCTCPAGAVGQYCKHRIRIIMGDPAGIVSGNITAVSDTQNWVRGTDVEKALYDLNEAERQFEEAKTRVSQIKKHLARTLRD